MTVRSIINAVADNLTDSDFVTWTEAELLSYLNDAQNQIVFYRPDAYSVVQAVLLAPGVTKQALPTGAIRLVDRGITRNMGADGLTPGRIITDVDQESMDLVDPDWHTRTPKTAVDHYIYSEAAPKDYYVTPPPHATTPVWVEMMYSSAPPVLLIAGIDSDEIGLDSIYENTIKEFMQYKAYSKETDSGESRSLAAGHFQAFGNLLGLKFKIDRMYSGSKEVKDAS